MENTRTNWWLPACLVAIAGVGLIVVGFATGGPDAVGGVVFGVVALAAAAVMFQRRYPKASPSAADRPDSAN